jgi:hypothetical protein
LRFYIRSLPWGGSQVLHYGGGNVQPNKFCPPSLFSGFSICLIQERKSSPSSLNLFFQLPNFKPYLFSRVRLH